MLLYRIEKEKHLEVFPSRGSLFSEGRWKGMWVVHTSETVSLAKLEALANSGSKLPENRCLVTIELKDQAPVVQISAEDLPIDWFRIPYKKNLSHYIQQIVDSRLHVAAIVPSIHSPKESNVLLFPDYPEFNLHVQLISAESLNFDPRLK